MAKFSLRLDNNFFFLSHNTSTSQSSILLNRTSRKNLHLQLSPSKHRLKLKFLCSIKEKENIKDEREKVCAGSGGLVNGVLVEELDRKVGLGWESGSREAGFDLVWPPWKNIPQRYKLIGTTSLAFVICNMDKVNLSVAIIPMSHQFGWNSSVAGLMQSSFFWDYALSQLPGGWIAKLFGGRKVLEIGVFAWSLATALVRVLADSCLDYSCQGFCDLLLPGILAMMGFSNTVGSVSGIVGVALTGFVLDSTHSWSMSLFAASIFFYLTGNIVWLAFASNKPQSFSESD